MNRMKIPFASKKKILALGSKENTSVCLLKDGEIFLSQKIGDTEEIENILLARRYVDELMGKTCTKKIDIVACDLHPGFPTTSLAGELAKKLSSKLIQVQHHCAHLTSLLVDGNIDEKIVCIVADGFGYGNDGNAWGGEILLYDKEKISRAGHLQYQKMPGLDLAVKFPARMVAGILYSSNDKERVRKILEKNCHEGFRHGKKEIELVLRQLEKNVNVFQTSSAGRVLDAISALLGFSYCQKYTGEPAITLEKFAKKGKEKFEFPIEIEKSNGQLILNTTKILEKVLELKEKGKKQEDIAASAQKALALGLAKIAVQTAKEQGIDRIGFTGGVAYNEAITRYIQEEVSKNKIKFLTHSKISPGDGNVSVGQIFIAAKNLQCV